MHRIYGFLALILAVHIFGSSFATAALSAKEQAEVSAAEGLRLKSANKVLYIGGCTGKKSDGKKAKYYSSVSVRKLMDGFSTKKYDIILKSLDEQIASVDSKKDRIYAQGIGKTTVNVTVKKKKPENNKTVFNSKIEITVKKNADPQSFIVEGITEGQVFYIGDSVIVDMPGDYTDLRKVTVSDDEVSIKPLKDGKSFTVTFDETGEYTVTAAAYQSKKYNGYTASAEFDVVVKEREAELKQTASDCLEISGGPVDSDMTAEALSVYEINNDADLFYSYISRISFEDENTAVLTLFKPLESEKEYELVFDGLSFRFKSAACKVSDLADFCIAEDSVYEGVEKNLTFSYFNRKNVDITKSLSKELDRLVTVDIKDLESFEGYLSNGRLYIPPGGKPVELSARLEIDTDQDGKPDISLESSKIIEPVKKKADQFTGNVIYTLKPDDGKSIKPGDQCISAVPLGDDVVLEALFEMEDGSYRTMKQAGITKLVEGNPEILMVGSGTKDGGCKVVLNSTGESGIIAYRDNEVAGSFTITVLPERKPETLKTELSKNFLNTDINVEDYIIIKADIYDQYGDIINGSKFEISQTEASRRNPGEIQISQISDGRFLVYGSGCPSFPEQRKVSAVISSGSLSEEIGFYIRDVKYDDRKTDYTFALKYDGSKIIDTALGIGKDAPKSTFVTVEIKDNGYYVGEGTGFFFEEKPLVVNGAEYYGAEPGDVIYGISVLFTDEKGNKQYLKEDGFPCVFMSYYEMEFCPYSYMEKLLSGNYEIKAYCIKLTDRFSEISECDSLNIRVIDSDPDIEVEQLIQSYSEKPESWEDAVTDYFSFKLVGEDISGYITKVDCVEASSGSVFVRQVEFSIPDPDYGIFTKTAVVERLITKQ